MVFNNIIFLTKFGMFPEIIANKCHFVGNTSGQADQGEISRQL